MNVNYDFYKMNQSILSLSFQFQSSSFHFAHTQFKKLKFILKTLNNNVSSLSTRHSKVKFFLILFHLSIIILLHYYCNCIIVVIVFFCY